MTTCQGYLFPIYLQKASGLSPGVSGLVLAIPALVLAGLAPLSGYLADKVGARYLVIGAFILLATGAFLIASVNSNTAVSVAVVFLMIVAMGNAFFQAPNNKLIMSNLDKSYLGIGGSVAQLMRYLGMQSGTTVTVLILYSRMSRISGTRVSSYVDGKPEIFMSGMQMVYLTIGILMLVCIVLNIIKPLSESLKTKKGN
jgi:MFS family permease